MIQFMSVVEEIRESLEALSEVGGELHFDHGLMVCESHGVWLIFENQKFLTASTDLCEVLYIVTGN